MRFRNWQSNNVKTESATVSYDFDTKWGPVAQRLEHAAHNRSVGGSIPPGPTTPSSRNYRVRRQRENGSQITSDRPMIDSRGTKPQPRESNEPFRLSPIIR